MVKDGQPSNVSNSIPGWLRKEATHMDPPDCNQWISTSETCNLKKKKTKKTYYNYTSFLSQLKLVDRGKKIIKKKSESPHSKNSVMTILAKLLWNALFLIYMSQNPVLSTESRQAQSAPRMGKGDSVLKFLLLIVKLLLSIKKTHGSNQSWW